MSGEGDYGPKNQQSLNEGFQSLADMPDFDEREAVNHEKQEKLHEKEFKLQKLCEDARDGFLKKHFKNSYDCDFRSTYNELSESEQEILEHYRFLEDAEAILDHSGDAYKNVVETYYDSHYEYQPGSQSFESYHDYTRSAAHERKNKYYGGIEYKWDNGYEENSFGSENLQYVMKHFANTAKKIFGEDTEEYYSILDELSSNYSNEESRPLEMFYKLKLKEFNDRKKLSLRTYDGRVDISRDDASILSFGALLDIASDKFDRNSDVIIRYGDFVGARHGSGYDGEETVNKNTTTQPSTQPSINAESPKPESSFVDDNGFRDWKHN